MSRPIAYIVRAGFVYHDLTGEQPRAYIEGETVKVDPDLGDTVHSLERATPVPDAPPPAPDTPQDVA